MKFNLDAMKFKINASKNPFPSSFFLFASILFISIAFFCPFCGHLYRKIPNTACVRCLFRPFPMYIPLVQMNNVRAAMNMLALYSFSSVWQSLSKTFSLCQLTANIQTHMAILPVICIIFVMKCILSSVFSYFCGQ